MRLPIWVLASIGLGLAAWPGCGGGDDTDSEWGRPAGKTGTGGTTGQGDGGIGFGGSVAAGDAAMTDSQTAQKESCDGLDNDGNGNVDEGCSCKVGSTQACYTGPANTRNIGECKDGTQTCEASAEFGAWGACTGPVLPSQDVEDGKDNDCNGIPDNKCAPGTVETCGNGKDDDCDGLSDCSDSDCPPCKEDCTDKIDNDGDGVVDCLDPDCPPCKENCTDKFDNDSDGLVDCKDPDCPPCNEGNCADGIDEDQDGLVDCLDPDCPCKEICGDGIDNDKDGKVDNADTDCASVCGPNGECCNGIDDNGDGRIDDGNVCDTVQEPCPPGAIKSCDCYCGVHRKCQANGTWGPCTVDGSCQVAQVTSHAQCGGGYCDFGYCVGSPPAGQCYHHGDCPMPQVCDLGYCIQDHYFACQ